MYKYLGLHAGFYTRPSSAEPRSNNTVRREEDDNIAAGSSPPRGREAGSSPPRGRNPTQDENYDLSIAHHTQENQAMASMGLPTAISGNAATRSHTSDFEFVTITATF